MSGRAKPCPQEVFNMKRSWLFWIPRGLIMLFALFTVVFSFDVFDVQAPWYRILLRLLVHNVPLMVLLIALRISWNRPAVGSILFYLFMLAFAFVVRSHGVIWVPLIFTVPLFIVATMFMVEYLKLSRASNTP